MFSVQLLERFLFEIMKVVSLPLIALRYEILSYIAMSKKTTFQLLKMFYDNSDRCTVTVQSGYTM